MGHPLHATVSQSIPLVSVVTVFVADLLPVRVEEKKVYLALQTANSAPLLFTSILLLRLLYTFSHRSARVVFSWLSRGFCHPASISALRSCATPSVLSLYATIIIAVSSSPFGRAEWSLWWWCFHLSLDSSSSPLPSKQQTFSSSRHGPHTHTTHGVLRGHSKRSTASCLCAPRPSKGHICGLASRWKPHGARAGPSCGR